MWHHSRDRLTIDDAFRTTQGASVEFRGIFINDEDWSLRPWSYGTYEPARFGIIGPKTYKKVFQLLLRLRANTIWPAMHTGTQPFFLTPGRKPWPTAAASSSEHRTVSLC